MAKKRSCTVGQGSYAWVQAWLGKDQHNRIQIVTGGHGSVTPRDARHLARWILAACDEIEEKS